MKAPSVWMNYEQVIGLTLNLPISSWAFAAISAQCRHSNIKGYFILLLFFDNMSEELMMTPNKWIFVRYVRTLRAGPQISGGAQQGCQTKQKQPKNLAWHISPCAFPVQWWVMKRDRVLLADVDSNVLNLLRYMFLSSFLSWLYFLE